MPLPFRSSSHGTIAFGFFNIEIDILLLEHWFFFAEELCRAVTELATAAAGESDSTKVVVMAGYRIDDPSAIGNVNAAIRGWDLSGFIGATYKRFPFPDKPSGFKQKPDGARNRDWADEVICQFGEPALIALRWDAARREVAIGEMIFTGEQLTKLVAYVDRGGYPRWQDEVRPAYVHTMMEAMKRLSSPFLSAAS